MDTDLKDIIQNMMQVNPYFRWSPQELLSYPIFDEIRQKPLEQLCQERLLLQIDEADNYDFENNKAKYDNR